MREVVLEEPPGNLAFVEPKVLAARKTLFGAWETDWLACNSAHNLDLPGARGPRSPFLMYPQVDVDGERIDCLSPDVLPDVFKYTITARDLST